jgi:excisionase family DNA binding protein
MYPKRVLNTSISGETERRAVLPTTAPPRLYKLREVAYLLGVRPARVRELVASGALPSVRLGEQGWHRFRLEDVERLIAGRENAP